MLKNKTVVLTVLRNFFEIEILSAFKLVPHPINFKKILIYQVSGVWRQRGETADTSGSIRFLIIN